MIYFLPCHNLQLLVLYGYCQCLCVLPALYGMSHRFVALVCKMSRAQGTDHTQYSRVEERLKSHDAGCSC